MWNGAAEIFRDKETNINIRPIINSNGTEY